MPAISRLSNETVWFPVRDTTPVGVPSNPTTLAVRLAVLSGVPPIDTDWIAAAWEATPVTIDGTSYYLARMQVGPGSAITLAVGNYNVWIRIGNASPYSITKGQVLQVY